MKKKYLSNLRETMKKRIFIAGAQNILKAFFLQFLFIIIFKEFTPVPARFNILFLVLFLTIKAEPMRLNKK